MEPYLELQDGRTVVRKKICGRDVTLVFSAQAQPEVLNRVTELIMAAYAERKSEMGKRSKECSF